MSFAFVGPRVPLSVQRRWLEEVQPVEITADTTIPADLLNKTLVLDLDAAWDITLPAPTSAWSITLHVPVTGSFDATIFDSSANQIDYLIPGSTTTVVSDGTATHVL